MTLDKLSSASVKQVSDTENVPNLDMLMTNDVVQFLKKVATTQSFQIFDSMFGTIRLGQPLPIIQSTGAVYGIWVQDVAPPRVHVAEIPGHPGWYPVYWGRDIAPVSRMKAHVQGHKANGNANLPAVLEIQGKPLIFGAILVERYDEFEALLHNQHRPLKGTSASGRSRTVVSIDR